LNLTIENILQITNLIFVEKNITPLAEIFGKASADEIISGSFLILSSISGSIIQK
jgi:hypothetical protein